MDAGPALPLIASPIADIPTYHPIQAFNKHNTHIIWDSDAFVNGISNDSDMIKTTRMLRQMRMHRRFPAAADGADQRASGIAPDPDGQGTWQSHHSTHTHPIHHTVYNHIQCQLTLFKASALAPASINTRHVASWPHLAATWRGVHWNCGGVLWV